MISRRGSPVVAWVRLMRVSNAPTVVGNVLAGAAVGMHTLPPGSSAPTGTLALVVTGTLLVYLAGMVLNDAFDARIDANERPGQPIPSGRVSVARAIAVGATMLAVGGAMLGVSSSVAWSVVLCASVLLYDLLHALLPGAFLLMAWCRACVPVLAALAFARAPDQQALWWVAGGLGAFVACVSLAARDEVRGFGASARLGARLVPLAALAPLGLWLFAGVQPAGWALGVGIAAAVLAACAGLLGLRLSRRGAARYAVPVAVGTWIGAIPLLDASACFLLGRPGMAACCVGMWALARVLRPMVASS